MGVAANCYTIWIMLTLFSVPRGAAIRLMGHAATVFMLAFASLVVGVPLSIAGCVYSHRSRRVCGVLGIVLNLVVLPVGFVLLYVVARIAGGRVGRIIAV